MHEYQNEPDTADEIEARDGIDTAVRAADLLRALANPHRLMIMRLLKQKSRTVMDLCSILSLRQSLVSQHLARLRLDGVVSAKRQGHFVIYALSNDSACRVLETLFEVLADGPEIAAPARSTWKVAVARSNGSKAVVPA